MAANLTYIALGNPAVLKVQELTVMALAKSDIIGATAYVGWLESAGGDRYQWDLNAPAAGRPNFFTYIGEGDTTGVDLLTSVGNAHGADTWNVHAATFVRNATCYLYRDGAVMVSAASSDNPIAYAVAPPGKLRIGSRERVNPRYHDGPIDEVRISSVAQSGEWVETDNKAITDTLLYYGNEDPPPTLSTLAATDVGMNGGTYATLNGNLTSLGGAPTCDVWFEWGYDTSYGNTVGTATVSSTGARTYNLTGFDPSKTIYYRFVGENVDGTTYGSAATFTVSNTTVARYYGLTMVTTFVWLAVVIFMIWALVSAGLPMILVVILAAIMAQVGVVGVQAILEALLSWW